MRHFTTERTSDYRAAVTALRRLPFEERVNAYAESVADEMERDATQEDGAKRCATCFMPFYDHPERRDRLYFAHAYALDMVDLRFLVRRCDEMGMSVRIDTDSWDFPCQHNAPDVL